MRLIIISALTIKTTHFVKQERKRQEILIKMRFLAFNLWKTDTVGFVFYRIWRHIHIIEYSNEFANFKLVLDSFKNFIFKCHDRFVLMTFI